MKLCGVTNALAALAVLACQEAPSPVAPVPAAKSAVTGRGAVAACPCWDEGRLAAAFPVVHFHDSTEGAAYLTRLDTSSVQQIQGLVRFATAGEGVCELASFGTEGRIEVLASADGLSAAQCKSCAGLLEGRAAASGFAIRPVERKAAD